MIRYIYKNLILATVFFFLGVICGVSESALTIQPAKTIAGVFTLFSAILFFLTLGLTIQRVFIWLNSSKALRLLYFKILESDVSYHPLSTRPGAVCYKTTINKNPLILEVYGDGSYRSLGFVETDSRLIKDAMKRAGRDMKRKTPINETDRQIYDALYGEEPSDYSN